MKTSKQVLVSKEGLTSYINDIFLKIGLSKEQAEIISNHLVLANLRGVDSHGVTRLAIYCKRFELGLINKHATIRIERETPSSALIDGNNGFGIVNATKGIQLAMKKARENGIAVVGVYNSNHCGMLSDYTIQAARNDCIALATTNAPSLIAPWGGKEPFFGTNPFSYGIPVGGEKDIIFDMATSVVARGKILLAKQNNTTIPLGWALTKDGNPTNDPDEALDGVLLPVGEHKGYGLNLMVEILSGIFTGANFGPHVGDLYDDYERTQKVGHTFIVMKADLFEDIDVFKHRVNQMIDEIKEVKHMDGVDEIYLPGEIETNILEERSENGIPLGTELVQTLHDIAWRYGISRKLA